MCWGAGDGGQPPLESENYDIIDFSSHISPFIEILATSLIIISISINCILIRMFLTEYCSQPKAEFSRIFDRISRSRKPALCSSRILISQKPKKAKFCRLIFVSLLTLTLILPFSPLLTLVKAWIAESWKPKSRIQPNFWPLSRSQKPAKFFSPANSQKPKPYFSRSSA